MDVGLPLPLFPLGTVLFPGMPLPLLVFENRYLAMIADQLTRPEDQRRFGVVAIRDGYEVGELAVHSAHRVGCEAVVRTVSQREDGRFDVLAVGGRRFRVTGMDETRSYLVGDVAWYREPLGDDVDVACTRALAAFEAYRARLGKVRGADIVVTDLPREPLKLSYALAAGGLFMLGDRQALLEHENAAARLTHLAELLRGETAAMTALPSLPATDVMRTGWSPN